MLSETKSGFFSIRTVSETPSTKNQQHYGKRFPRNSTGTRKRDNLPGELFDRIKRISGRLQSVLIRPSGFEGDVRLLVDSGSSINLIKDSNVPETIVREGCTVT